MNKKFFFILICAIAFRFLNIDKGLNTDEGALWQRSSLAFEELLPSLKTYKSAFAPLSLYTLHGWTKISHSEIWTRCYFIFFGIALCLLLYLLGKTFVDKTYATILFCLSGISPLLIWGSQHIRNYIDATFWVILSFFFMMKILQNTQEKKTFHHIAYIFSSVLALYSSYINIVIKLSENIFIFLFYFRERPFLKRWILLQSIIAVLFLPCLFLLFHQLKDLPAIHPGWNTKGFHILNMNIGVYARGMIAVLGMDPNFLNYTPSTHKSVLFFLAILSFIPLSLSFKKIKNTQNPLIFFSMMVIVLSLLIHILFTEFLYYPLSAKYLMPQHALFLMVLVFLIHSLKFKTKVMALLFVSLVYGIRIPEAIQPFFDTKKASVYLSHNIQKQDCLLFVRNINYHIDPSQYSTFILRPFLEESMKSYLPLNDKAQNYLASLKKCSHIWFHENEGNDNILGANALVTNWLEKNGYSISHAEKFRKIAILRYRPRASTHSTSP